MTTVSVVTCWKDHPELCADYERAVDDADQVVIIDNSHDIDASAAIKSMSNRLGATHFSTYAAQTPFSFAASCNMGIRAATGDVIVCLNNDIRAVPGWLDAVRRDVKPGALYAVSTDIRVVEGYTILYLEGWCIAATILTWQDLGGWDAETFQRPYWEDVDLSWRATQLGIRILRRPWMVTHLGNTTSATTKGAYDGSKANGEAFARKVAAARAVAA